MKRFRNIWLSCLGAPTVLITGLAVAGLVPMTLEDFHLSGTQVGEVSPTNFKTSDNCAACHGDFDAINEPYATWRGSLMGQAGRDPLFFAQMTTANQDVANVGYFCMRCHVPMSFVTQHAYQTDGSTLDARDRDGVNCHLCHSMVDPIYKPGISPSVDASVLANLDGVPDYYGNSMFVLDPMGLRRGPYSDPQTPHAFVQSTFHLQSDICGTCHDVGNVAVTKGLDGKYAYNAINATTPTEDLSQQFPLERTFTEWKLSAFANGGVNMGGRFGGEGATVIGTCQDCHMPRTSAQGCFYGPQRDDLARHDFSGASAWVLRIIGQYSTDDPDVDQAALEAGQERAISMLERAASLQVEQQCGSVRVRVVNESGHKIPTGHIEGRRIWINVKIFDDGNQLIREFGQYDGNSATLDEGSTKVYEMHVGLSEQASKATGFPAGVTTHMALADVIEKDTRIPPRGFNNATYEAGGAPAVGTVYADGQYWDDTVFWLPDSAAAVTVTLNYQTVTSHYIEALRNGNVTDDWGNTLYQLWLDTGKDKPIPMATSQMSISPSIHGDSNGDGSIDRADYPYFVNCHEGPRAIPRSECPCMDFDGDGDVDLIDFGSFQTGFQRK